jgi:hypothetical protein
MNNKQKIILIFVISIIIGMLVYPPYQFHRNDGVACNAGYGWLMDPLHSGRATVNIAMLLTQWVGVLITGGLAFYLVKTPLRKTITYNSIPQDEKHLQRPVKPEDQ